jgi:hypothetical protein
MKTQTKVRMVFYIDRPQRQALDRISQKTGAPVAELIRRAVDSWLKRQE